MRFTSLLLSLAVAPFILAQEQNAEGSAAPAPAAEGGAAPAAGGESADAAKTKSAIGAQSSNTGQGNGIGNDAWKETSFEHPNRNYYWVNEVENTASWVPFNASTNLEIYNSNNTVLGGNKQIAAGIPAGVGSWTGLVSGFKPGNNYIMILTLADEPDRKIAQTDGFWIKSKGTIPEASVTAAGESLTGTLAVSTSPAAETQSGAAQSDAAAAGSAAPSGAENQGQQNANSAAGRSTVAGLAVAAAAVAAAAF